MKKEATVILAKCKNAHKSFGIRVEKKDKNEWNCTWAFKITEKAAGNEGYSDTMVSGKIDIDKEYPGCPYCGSDCWFQCGKCGKLNCYSGEESRVTCEWCGSTGDLRAADTFDLKGGGY